MKNRTLGIFAALALAVTASVIGFNSANAGTGDYWVSSVIWQQCDKHGTCWRYHRDDKAAEKAYARKGKGDKNWKYYDWYLDERDALPGMSSEGFERLGR